MAALSGAGITAWINRKNTVQTLNAAVERDHAAWLRGQKQEAYTDFLMTVDSVLKEILANRIKPAADLPTIHAAVTQLTRLRLVCSDDTGALATTIANRLGDVLSIARETQEQLRAGLKPGEPIETSIREAVRVLYGYVNELIGIMRNEFETDAAPARSVNSAKAR